MPIDRINNQAPQPEPIPAPVKREMEKNMGKEAATVNQDSTQKQVLQILASAQPQQQIQKSATNQAPKGRLDIRI